MSKIRNISICLFILFLSTNIYFAKSRKGPLRSFGDYAQIINPVIAAGLSSQEKGFGHFAIIYGQSWVTMHSIVVYNEELNLYTNSKKS